tara:strand:+ start:2194 stop:3492 length:1299 start_codon:yes stop_codon:yes gene_type:complete
MGCLFLVIRSVASLVLGVVIFFGFLFWLLLNNFSDKLLSADFYTDTIAGEDTYNRVYDEVLLDAELKETTDDLLGDIQVVTHEEIVELLKEIVPPDYVQSQVEGSIQRTVAYFNDEVDTLELYVELGPPLDNIKPILFRYIDGRIDGLVEEDPGAPVCNAQQVDQMAGRFEATWRDLSGGVVPQSIPSIKAFPQTCRQLIFDAAFDRAIDSVALDARAKAGLRLSRSEIRSQFIQGDTLGVLKQAARPLATPLMDDALDEIRKELDQGDRLDLIHRITAWNDDISEAELRSDIDDGRDWVNRGRDFGKPLALIMVVGGSILMGLVHFPSLSSGLRWPGAALAFTGAVFFGVGKVVQSRVPDWLRDLVDRGAEDVSDIPPSVTGLGGDLLVSFGKQLTDGFVGPSLTLLIIGGLLVGGSFLVFLVKPFIPGVR